MMIRRSDRVRCEAGMARPAAPVTSVWAAFSAALLLAAPAFAFDSKGHVVIEALAYRTLAEGHDGQPPRPDVLRDLINDGALEPPFCFGRGDTPPKQCVDAPASNPLLDWPQPLTDRPDAAFRRQFSDPGQCFHYMATLADAQTDPLPGTAVPRALAENAVVRCNDLLDELIQEIVLEGGTRARQSSRGLYELMHAVGDSFSGSHTERSANGKIDYLRIWKPIERLARLPTERSARIPDAAYHKWNDHRDKTYVIEEGAARCEKRTDNPYDVPYECLSPEGDAARRALAELLVLTRDLRAAQLAAPKGTYTQPERSEAWREYKARWFAAAHPCEGAACAERQPPDMPPGAYVFLGLDTSWNPTRDFVDISARGSAAEVRLGPEPVPLWTDRERRLPAIHGRRGRRRPRRARCRPRAAGRASHDRRPPACRPSLHVRRREVRFGARVAPPAFQLQAERTAVPLRRRADGSELVEAQRWNGPSGSVSCTPPCPSGSRTAAISWRRSRPSNATTTRGCRRPRPTGI